MRNRVERLRIWLLGSAGFLVLVIAAFLGSARYLSRHRLALPARLGVNIVRETNGYTYSQSVQGKTVFTIHAAKAVEHSDSKIALHDVSIALYGEKQDRNDRIYGDEFEYDQKAGVVRATGLVHMDLQTAQAGGGKAAGRAVNANAKVLHVTTSGLVYLVKLGVAATSEPLDFQSGTMTGHATGADYSSDTGLLLLHSAVSMSGRSGKRAMVVTSATADLDNRNQEVFLSQARYVSQGQTVEAQQATLHTRPDGTLARVEAQGNVTMVANGATMVSQQADVVLNAKSQPQSAVMTGGVLYTSGKPLREVRGQAEVATIAFDAQGQAEHAVFTGAVHMSERMRATEAAREPWSTRDLTAAKVEATLARVGTGSGLGKPQLRDAEATGSAHLTVVSSGSLASTRGAGTTELSADDLKAHMIPTSDAKQPPRLDTVAGRGHTLLRQVRADGMEQTSSGDSLDAKFRAGSSSHSSADSSMGGEGVDDLWSAVQQGHVSMMRRAPAKSGAKANAKAGGQGNAQQDVVRAGAERAAYDGDLDRVTLSGGVQVSDADSVLWANQVALDRATGDARAVGAVKVNYLRDDTQQAGGVQGGGSHAVPGDGLQQVEPAVPTHILAERADLEHASGVATFYGRPVRLWQGGSQVQAPVIELSRAQQRLIARGEASAIGAAAAQTAQVHTVLLSAGSDASGTAKVAAGNAGTGKAAARLPEVVRIASGGLVYSGVLRQAEFGGGVRAETVDGAIRASQATVYLRQAAGPVPSSAGDAVPSLEGDVERMVATGQIEIEQPGRRATGERLVYTASDRLFVLTGDGKVQPKLVDAAHGTITGAALQFHSGDDSVVVSNVVPGATGAAAGQRVRTETHTGKDATMGKGK